MKHHIEHITCTNSFNPHTDFEASILIMNNFIKIYPKNQEADGNIKVSEMPTGWRGAQ